MFFHNQHTHTHTLCQITLLSSADAGDYLGINPNCHQARGRVHSGQVVSLSQGWRTHTNI